MVKYCGFMNYFLRPANHKVSIKRNEKDKNEAFENILKLKEILLYDKLIFTSKMSFCDFEKCYKNRNSGVEISFDVVPHPSTSWWNRKSKAYKDSFGNKLTGKEKLIDILRNTDF
jgi:hypothetical protein